uniref:Intraflagellar transport 80 family protein n=1 Tax=Neospora caninum (strain Liverpool) TaxID=572307 RepID=A0A0F7U4S9_NEOCL|nr:TPA: intraflagellar transport 80 family protein [Neospora caninum Liverpool]
MRVLFDVVSTDARLPVVRTASPKSSTTPLDIAPLWPAPLPNSGLCGDAEWIVLDANDHSADPHFSSSSAFGNREDLLTAHRDGRICRWSGRDSTLSTAETLLTVSDTTVTCFAAVPGRRDISESFDHPPEEPCIVVGTEDGSLKCFRQPVGSQEWVDEATVPEAHALAVTSVTWSPDGSHFVSAGDDGEAKLWSRRCQARAVVEKCDAPVAAVSWSTSADALVVGFGEKLRVATLRDLVTDANEKHLGRSSVEWRAHKGAVLTVDWSRTMILSGGEDGHYKIWNPDGALLFTGSSPRVSLGDAHPFDPAVTGNPLSAVTAVRWSPSGDTFAVGSNDWIAVCDRSGRILSQTFREFGLPHTLAWTRDGAHLAVASTPSLLALGRIIPDPKRWRTLEVSVDSDTRLLLKDLKSQASRRLEQRDSIAHWSIACDALLVVTTRQCFVYKLSSALACLENCQAAYVDDLQQPCFFAKQGVRHACLVQPSQIQVDAQDRSRVRAFDILTGSTVPGPSGHYIGIKECGYIRLVLYACEYMCVKISLSQQENTQWRKLVILDDAGSLFLSPLHSPCWTRLHTSPVQSFAWDETNALVAISNSTVVCWFVPAASMPLDLLEEFQITKEAGDKNLESQIVAFHDGYLTMRRPDGALLQIAVSPFANAVFDQIAKLRELGTAEIAFAAIGNTVAVHQLQCIHTIAHPIRRTAETALLCRKTDDAVHLLLEHGLVYRALEILMEVHRWQEALDLATAYKTHVDTVVAHRKKFLDGFGLSETDSKFKAALQATEIDWSAIQAKIRMDTEREEKATNAAARPHTQS